MKSFTDGDVQTCKEAVDQGIPVILDLCDNIFIDEYAEGRNLSYSPRENFRTMARMGSAVVTTGPALKQAIENFVEGTPPVRIIPDGCETLDDMHYALTLGNWQRSLAILRHSPRGFWHLGLAQMQRFPKVLTHSLKRQVLQIRHPAAQTMAREAAAIDPKLSPPRSAPGAPAFPGHAAGASLPSEQSRKTVLWFGNHGTSYGQVGMATILEVCPALYQLNQHIPLRLRIVSNSYRKYLQLIEPLPFPTDYIEWHPTEVYHHIATSDVVIIPNSKSPFSICKSANRAVLALSLGVPVVATNTPALHPLGDCILVDDWDQGLGQYLNQPELVDRHIHQAQAVIESTYSGPVIAQQWITLLDELQHHRYGQP